MAQRTNRRKSLSQFALLCSSVGLDCLQYLAERVLQSKFSSVYTPAFPCSSLKAASHPVNWLTTSWVICR